MEKLVTILFSEQLGFEATLLSGPVISLNWGLLQHDFSSDAGELCKQQGIDPMKNSSFSSL